MQGCGTRYHLLLGGATKSHCKGCGSRDGGENPAVFATDYPRARPISQTNTVYRRTMWYHFFKHLELLFFDWQTGMVKTE